jgi:cytochrome c oxidase subunit 2
MESESAGTMIFGEYARRAGMAIKAIGLSLALAVAPQAAIAAAPAAPAPVAAVAPATAATPAAAASADAKEAAKGSYVPMKPTPGKGMPVPGAIGFQHQYSPLGDYALWMHNSILMPLIVAISLFVLLLLMIVVARFNRRANPVPSKTSHNTLIEVIWTLVPVLILVGVAIPSIDLLAKQYKPAPAKALTIKATGNQWFWTYSYPDNGGFEVISNMLPDAEAIKRGEPEKLGVDNRMVVPVGEPIRIQTTGADVIHSFSVPSLWFKIDAVPGRINEKVMFIKEPGVYYGQCSELCGARHGYMPIAVEALPRDKFNAWVLTQGGEIDGKSKAAASAPASAPAAPAAAVAAPSASAAPAASVSPAPAA